MEKLRNTACALCSDPLTPANNSGEHLVPNAIGGVRQVRDFICRKCNGDAGQKWDAVLAKELNPLCLLLRIKRDRGENPHHDFPTAGGETIRLHNDGRVELPNPSVVKIQDGEKHIYDIRARSKKEAVSIIRNLQAKNPKIDADKFIAELTDRLVPLEHPLMMSITMGGLEMGRCLVKSALALAVDSGVSPSDCPNALAYLKADKAPPCFGYYFEKDLIQNRPTDIVFHCVAVSGSSSDGMLLGYVEYFCGHRMVVCLSENYKGPNVHEIYAINPVSGKEVDLSFTLNFSKDDLEAIYRYEKIPPGSMEAAMATSMIVARAAEQERRHQRLYAEVGKAIEYAFLHCGAKEGDDLTDEQLLKLMALAEERLVEAVRPYLRRKNPN